MSAFDVILIVSVVGASVYACVKEYRINKEDARKTEKHLIREFFNHFGDTWNYRR